ncbi:MAG: cobalamin-dependent protein [Planctomycetes bacterium]|nr:cobalamin-dependent protein [Planctomycetota bacterium]
MRVTIVAANQEHKPDPVVPLGAALVAAAARSASHDVRFYDACFAGARWPMELAEQLCQFKPAVVGLSLRNVDDVAWPRAFSYLDHYRAVARVIRENAPQAKLVLGGSAFSLFPDEFLSTLGADYGIAGEGEQAFPRLLEDIEAQRNPPRLVCATPLEVPNGDVEPALDLLDLDQYYRRGGALNVQTRRGCPFLCSYCTYPMLEGGSSRPASIVRVVDSLQRLHEERGFDHFFIVDNTFNAPAAHALAVCRTLQARKLKLRWTAYVTPAGLTREVVQEMAQAGCTSVDLGTDAASTATLSGLKKSFTQAEIANACQWLHEARIRFSHSLMLGGPGESPATLEETRAFVNATRPAAVIAMLGVRVYPGTALATEAKNRGMLDGQEIGLQPLFYISDEVRDLLEEFAKQTRDQFPFWYFPGLEGNRWQRFWQRQRAHGARGPLWAIRPDAPAITN